MELMKNTSTVSINIEDNTRLLFFENYKNEKNQYNIEEIFFGKAVLLQQIRILKVDSNPHPKIKSMQSITQSAPIYNFEIFGRNLKKYSDKFECIFESQTINESQAQQDSIIPLFTDFVTNHIVIRGMFEKITLCIYGVPYTGTEGHLLIETAKNDVPLEKLQNVVEDLYQGESGERINLTNDDFDLLNTYTIENLISPYIKCEVQGGLKRAYYINPPNLNMIEKTKTGYIYYENDLIYYSQSLFNFYLLNENKDTILNGLNGITLTLDDITHQTYFKKICEIIKILIKKNFCFLEEDCVFRKDNIEIFNKLPDFIIQIILSSLEGKYFGFVEIKNGLKLLKIISNSKILSEEFVEKGGLEILYAILLQKIDKNYDNINNSNPLELKVMTLENIYRLITYSKVFTRFMENLDKTKFHQQYFMIKEYVKDQPEEVNLVTIKSEIKDSGLSKKKSKTSDRDKKKSKKEKKSKKDRRPSKSRSRSKSRDRSRTISKESISSSNLYKKTYDKKQAKNVLLKNGYQIILTLIIGKKNNLIFNMVRKIMNKVSFLLYLKEFSNFIKSEIFDKNLHFDKVTNFLQKIFEYLQKIDIYYKKSFDKDQPCGFLNDYTYRNFWIEYLKINRRFFKKSENYNLKSTIEHENNNMNKIYDGRIITNEIAIILEENNFLENIILLLTEEKIQKLKQYTEYSIIVKNILSHILLSKGGINYFSKNFDLTMILRNFLIKATDDLLNNNKISGIVKEENFNSVRIQNIVNNVTLNKSQYENDLYSNINNLIVNLNTNIELNEDFIIKINLLQLRYLLELQFVFLSKFDDLVMFKIEDSKTEDYIDKSLDILLIFSQNLNRSNLSKQAFFSLLQNEYFIDEIINLIKSYLENDSIEYEAHITLILEIINSVFTENKKVIDVILLLHGSTIYEILNKLREKMQFCYDSTETDPVNREFYNKFDSILNLLKSVRIFNENSEIKTLMNFINESLFNNIQKYNLNEKPVNEDNLKDENIKEYVKGLKLNILNYVNGDVNFLESIRKKNSLINELFIAVKIINLSIRINPLLLIDCVGEHIHLTLRYLIVNTVSALKHLLSNETREYHVNIREDLECDRLTKIKEYSIFLNHLYEILTMLLNNLLSSHVDNYRDNVVIDNTLNLLIILINFLFEIYSTDKIKSDSAYFTDSNLYIVEYVQLLFETVLHSFKEICKFNTTIKLNFEKILEKFSEKPSNKGPMIFILNFMFNIVNNDYTIETFVEHFLKIQKSPQIDIFSDLDSPHNKYYSIKLGNICEEKNFLHYVIEMGVNTNNEWIMSTSADLLKSIQKSYLDKSKGKIYQDINDFIINLLITNFNKINRVNATIMEDKEIENFLSLVDQIFRIVKFILLFLKSEFKFIFIFHDITNLYSKILNYFYDYLKITQNVNLLEINSKKLLNKTLDILIMINDSFILICDSKIKFITEENSNLNFDLVEELPGKNDILNILKDSYNFIQIENINEIFDFSYRIKEESVLIKYLILSNMSIKILTKLSKNFYGQSLILYNDYPNYLPNFGKSIFTIDDIFKFTIEKLNQGGDYIFYFVDLAEHLIMTISLLFYDLNYFETLDSQLNNYGELFTHSDVIVTGSRKLIKITETRLNSLLQFVLGNNFIKECGIIKNFNLLSENLNELTNTLNNIILNNTSNIFVNKLNKIIQNINLIKIFENLEIIQSNKDENNSNIKTIKLPNARKILEKYEIIKKYYEFYSTQNYAYDLPIQNNPKDSNLMNQIMMNKYSDYSKHTINEFEKLLNWKKYRIYQSKMDNLTIRNSTFDLDINLKIINDTKLSSIPVDIISQTLTYKKLFTYFNNEPFEQFCNQMLNENLLLSKFTNLSYFITSSTIHGYIFSSEDYFNSNLRKLFNKNIFSLKYDLEFVKNSNVIKGATTMTIRTKKKVNSKLNTFIYKPKYDKLPKQLFVTQVPTTMSIRDSSRYSSIVSGRPLSTHVDKVNPTQGVVNLTYGMSNAISASNAIVVVDDIKENIKTSDEEMRIENLIKTQSIEESIEILDKDNTEIVLNQNVSNGVTMSSSNVIVNPSLNLINPQNMVNTGSMSNIQMPLINSNTLLTKPNIINPQINLRMMNPNQPQNFVSNQNFMSGGYNPMGGMPNQMGMSNQPQGNNPMINYSNQMQYNFPNIRQMNPMMGGQNMTPYGQNYGMNKMPQNMQNMPQNMQSIPMNQNFNYSHPQLITPNYPNQPQPTPYDLQRLNPLQSAPVSTTQPLLYEERTQQSNLQTSTLNAPSTNPNNLNILTNILQAYSQLTKQDKSKDPRQRKNKK